MSACILNFMEKILVPSKMSNSKISKLITKIHNESEIQIDGLFKEVHLRSPEHLLF